MPKPLFCLKYRSGTAVAVVFVRTEKESGNVKTSNNGGRRRPDRS